MGKYALVLALAYGVFLVSKLDFGIVYMEEQHKNRHYVEVRIPNTPYTPKKFLFDTGATHTVINEAMLEELKQSNSAIVTEEFNGTLADGSIIVFPMYRVSSIMVGDCRIDNIDVVVLPGNGIMLLGASTLLKVAPFIFSVDPPLLIVTHCNRV